MKRQLHLCSLVTLLLASLLSVGACGCSGVASRKPSTVIPTRTRNAYGHWLRQEAYNQRISLGHVNLIFVGDSITQRWDRQGTQIWQKYYSRRNAVNLGVDGDRTQNVLWRLDHGNIDGIQPKVAVVMVGTNNSSDGDTAEEIADGIIAVCKKLRTRLPRTKILLLAVFPRGPQPSAQRQLNAKASQIASKIADGEMIHYMDIGDKLLAPDGSISREVMYDYLHLTAGGYGIWAQAIEPKLKELLGEEHSAVTPSHKKNGWTVRCEAMSERAKCGYADLVFIGDSITHGWEGRGAAVWEKYYGDRKAINLGIGGDRTEHVLWRLENGNIDGISPKVAVVMIGTNNHPTRNTPEEIGDGIIAVCKKLRQKLPRTKILLLAIFPRGEKPSELREQLAQASHIASKIADGKMIHYLDIGDEFLEPDGSMSKEIMSDFLHPGAKGYQIWAEAIEPKLKELLGEK